MRPKRKFCKTIDRTPSRGGQKAMTSRIAINPQLQCDQQPPLSSTHCFTYFLAFTLPPRKQSGYSKRWLFKVVPGSGHCHDLEPHILQDSRTWNPCTLRFTTILVCSLGLTDIIPALQSRPEARTPFRTMFGRCAHDARSPCISIRLLFPSQNRRTPLESFSQRLRHSGHNVVI